MTSEGWPYALSLAIPTAITLELLHASDVVIFVTAAVGVIPTAAMMGRATEELAARSGPGIGGLLNVTFGNFPELVIALFALNAGLHEVVKASIVGSIVGNILLVLGASLFVGGLGRDRQNFNATAAQAQSTMLVLAVGALILPAVFELVEGSGLPAVDVTRVNYDSTVEKISLLVSGVLMFSYACGLLFSLKTHRDIFNPVHEEDATEAWTVRRSVAVLAVAGIMVGVMSEILVGSITAASESIGMSEFFLGAFVIAIVGNAAEHWVAVLMAHKNKIDLAVNIAVGSGAQIALFVAPVLVLASFFMGPFPMPLVFNGFELAAILIAVFSTNHITVDGESTWFEGLQLLALYAVIGIVFFFA